jgi:hypothetical protein
MCSHLEKLKVCDMQNPGVTRGSLELQRSGAQSSVLFKSARASQAHDFSFGDPEVVIAIVDTGIDSGSPRSGSNIW